MPGSRFCSQCGAKLDAEPTNTASISARDIRAALPSAERRQLTVMFCDLVGSTARSTQLDPEDLREVMAAYHSRVAEVVGRYEGFVAQYLGDGALVFFGYPRAHEDDAQRSVRAALEIVNAVQSLECRGQKLQVRVGIATGPVVVGEIIGAGALPEKGAIGETPNLAARLQAIAAPNAVVVSSSTQRLAQRQFQYHDLGRHTLKGFAQGVQAWQVLGVQPERRFEGMGSSTAPLIGRRAELAQLCSVLDSSRKQGRGRAVYIRGEAGIGKTRLLEEFCSVAREQGFACHTGLVLNFGAGAGRDAIGALARDILGLTLNSSVEAMSAAVELATKQGLIARDETVFINDLLDIPQPPHLRTTYDAMDNSTRDAGRRMAIPRLIERASRVQPRVLAVEDLHWADRSTLAQLAVLTTTAANCPVLLVMTSRLEHEALDQAWRAETGASPLSVIELAPLHADEAAVLAAPFVAANAETAMRCVERAAGNPLFLEQLLRHAIEGADAAVPGSIQSLVQARLDRLDASDRAALQAASVLGQRFDRAALAHLLELPNHNPEHLLARRMIRKLGDEFLFDHALIQEAIYDGLLRSRRRELHLRAATWFAERDKALTAAHLDRAGDAAAARAYLEAARVQVRDYRYDAARKSVERGLEIASQQPERFGLGYLRGEILYHLGDMPLALEAFARALAMAGDDAERCRAWIGCARVKRVIDDLDGAFVDLAHAESVAVALGLKVEEAQLRFLRGNLSFPRGDVESCLSEHRRSLELARDAGAVECEAEALGGLGDAEYMRGHMLGAYRYFESCIDLAHRHGLGRIGVANRSMAAFTRWLAGEAREALSEAREAIVEAKRIGHKRAEMIAHHAAYFCLLSLAEFAAAADHASHSLLLARQLHSPRFEAETLAYRAEINRLMGKGADAQSDIEHALSMARAMGMAYMGPIMLGIAALISDDAAVRRKLLCEADTLLAAGAVSHNHLLFRKDAIEVCLQIGDWEGSDRYATELESYAREEPLPLTEFFVARGRVLAVVGRALRNDLIPELRRLIGKAERLGFLVAVPALRSAVTRIEQEAMRHVGPR